MSRYTKSIWKKSRHLGFSVLETGDELKKRENESAENAAKSARAYADLIEARAAMQAARAEFEAGHKTIREIRKQLESVCAD